jgi:DNA-binding Xre family transcriptional regulator
MATTWILKQWLTTNRGLKDAKEIRDIIRQRTHKDISLRTIQSLLNNKPKALHINTLQAICSAFRCKLSDFCIVKPSSRLSLILVSDLKLQTLLQPCAIASHETLYSFVARVQLAAVEEALSISDTYAQAARRLGYARASLHQLHARLQKPTPRNHNSRRKRTRTMSRQPIALPPAIFTIRKHEDLQSFIRRIQLAAIIQTSILEFNHSRAAVSLGYCRSSLVDLISKLRARGRRKAGK